MNSRSLQSRRSLAAISIPEALFAFVLIGTLVFFVGFSFIRRPGGQQTKARFTVQNIKSALLSYRTDYGKFPQVASNHSGKGKMIFVGDPNSGADVSNAGLFDVLRAIDRGVNANHALNRRQQRYIEEIKATGSWPLRGGFVDGPEFPSDIQGQLLDPWGTQYCIVMNTAEDECLNLGSIYLDLPENIKSPVAVFSLGKNGKLGGKDYPNRYRKPSSSEPPEDLVSWE